MKVIIAGSRDADQFVTDKVVDWCVRKSGYNIRKVISGKAKGADSMGEAWAERNNVPVIGKPADWYTYGKRAGFIRNSEMANIADACIIIYDGKSPGSTMMMNLAINKGLPTFVLNYTNKTWLSYNEMELINENSRT